MITSHVFDLEYIFILQGEKEKFLKIGIFVKLEFFSGGKGQSRAPIGGAAYP